MNHNFLSASDANTLLVYGLVSNPSTVSKGLGPKPRDAPYLLSNRYGVISPLSPPFRLCSPGWIDLMPTQMAELSSTDALFQICRQRVIYRTSPFARPVRSFLGRYFDFVVRQTESHRDQLEAAAPHQEVFGYSDWNFSAWLPLSQAQVLLPMVDNAEKPSFAELDIGFWLSGQLVGVMIEGNNTPIKSKREKQDFLQDSHPQAIIIRVPKERLFDAESGFPEDLFPEDFGKFWAGLSLPQGPYQQHALLHNLGSSAGKISPK